MDATGATMHAMVLHATGAPLLPETRPLPAPGAGEIRLRVAACAVCRTDLHVVDGDLPPLARPIVPGHEIVGYVDALGPGVAGFAPGQRVGVPWLGSTCGHCRYCRMQRENLCDAPVFTGYTRDGGFASHAVADARYVFDLEGVPLDDVHAAPLMCAGSTWLAWPTSTGTPPAMRMSWVIEEPKFTTWPFWMITSLGTPTTSGIASIRVRSSPAITPATPITTAPAAPVAGQPSGVPVASAMTRPACTSSSLIST